MSQDPRNSDDADELLWEAIARYQAGESTPEESSRVAEHLAQHPADRALLDLVESSVSGENAEAVDVDAALVKVRRRLIAMDVPPQPTLRVMNGGEAEKHSRPRALVMGVAAMLVATIGIATWQGRDREGGETVAHAVDYATAAGKLDTLELSDGTRVVLAPGSSMHVDSGYNVTHRTVQLSGLGYFDVAHAKGARFTVSTPFARIEDIGTAFTVRSDSAAGATVVVVNGQVRLTSTADNRTVDLFAGDRVAVPTSGQASEVSHHTDTAAVLSWTSGRLSYRGAPLSAVAADMRQWYGVVLQTDESLASRTLDAELRGDSLSEALRVITLALGARVEQRGDTLYLREAVR